MIKIMKLSSLISIISVVLFASCSKNDVTNVTLNKTTSYLIIGQTDSLLSTLTATGDIKNIPQTWTSSDPTIATVKDGIITAMTSGTVNITVKAGGIIATCVVTVEDKIQPFLSQAELIYYGDAYGTKDSIEGTGSNNFVLIMASSGINIDNLSGNGELLIVELNTSLAIKDSIPVGTYDMNTDLSPYSLVPAWVDSNNTPWGCWYFGNISDPITNGNLIVTRVNNIYTINYELFDDFGVKIYGTYKGTFSYVNALTQVSQASVKNFLKLKSQSTVNKPMKFKRR